MEGSQNKKNKAGLRDQLKEAIENLSGYSMDDVKVHHNSDKPQQLNSAYFTQGADIHLEEGKEIQFSTEAWHVVQQKKGRVQPIKQLKGNTIINADTQLEAEADLLGKKAAAGKPGK